MPASRFIFGSLPWYSVLVTAGIAVTSRLAVIATQRRMLRILFFICASIKLYNSGFVFPFSLIILYNSTLFNKIVLV